MASLQTRQMMNSMAGTQKLIQKGKPTNLTSPVYKSASKSNKQVKPMYPSSKQAGRRKKLAKILNKGFPKY